MVRGETILVLLLPTGEKSQHSQNPQMLLCEKMPASRSKTEEEMRVIFKQLPKWIYGECSDEIWIDLKKRANPGYTFIHELCHYFHPDWSETKVIREARKIWKSLTQRERFTLYHKLFGKWREP